MKTSFNPLGLMNLASPIMFWWMQSTADGEIDEEEGVRAVEMGFDLYEKMFGLPVAFITREDAVEFFRGAYGLLDREVTRDDMKQAATAVFRTMDIESRGFALQKVDEQTIVDLVDLVWDSIERNNPSDAGDFVWAVNDPRMDA